MLGSKERMEVTERRGPSEPHPPRLALLFEGPAQPFVVPLLRGRPLVVGRRAPADIVIDDGSLSRQHARFVWEEDGVWVEDLGSTNGSKVSDKPVTRALLVPGDAVTLGAVPVRIHALHAPAPAEPIQPSEAFEEGLRARIERSGAEPLVVALVADGTRRPMDVWVPTLRASLLGEESLGFYASGGLVIAGANREDLEGRLALAARRDDLRIGVAEYPAEAESADELLARVHRLVDLASPSEPLRTAQHYPLDDSATQVVASASMREVYAQVGRVASTRAPVLLVGETGVGKELVARAIHERSERRSGPMKALNCGAIPSTLQESVLFGHERGAFTGADKQMPGLFEQAEGGTVFLDEVGELPPETQAALLRTLETGRVLRVGATTEVAVDVRVLSATHRDLDDMVVQGSFRRDLLYRLNTVVISVPPLRERPEEVRPLVDLFLRKAADTGGKGRHFSERALVALERYGWPGNVRELRNVVDRAVIMALRAQIDLADLPQVVASGASRSGQSREFSGPIDRDGASRGPNQGGASRPAAPGEGVGAGQRHPSLGTSPADAASGGDLRAQLRDFESRLILEALAHCDYNKTRTAEHLGIPVRTLAHKIQSLGLKGRLPPR